MIKKRWNRDFSDDGYFWDKLTLCTLLKLSTTTYEGRVNLYDGLDDDPVADGFYFLKDHSTEISKDSLIHDFEEIFTEKSDYENWSNKTVSKEQKKIILSKCKEMIRKYSTSLQNWRAVLKYLPWELLVFILVAIIPCNFMHTSYQKQLIFCDILSGVLCFASFCGHFYIERTLKKGKSLPARLDKQLSAYSNFQWAEEEIEKLLDFYPSLEKKKLQEPKRKKQKIDYESMTREEKENAFFLSYKKIKERFPLFFEAYRALGILDENNQLINPEKDQKELLIVIRAIKEGSRNKLPLLQAIFKTTYSDNRLKEHANEKDIAKAENLVKRLEITQERIRTNTIKSK